MGLQVLKSISAVIAVLFSFGSANIFVDVFLSVSIRMLRFELLVISDVRFSFAAADPIISPLHTNNE